VKCICSRGHKPKAYVGKWGLSEWQLHLRQVLFAIIIIVLVLGRLLLLRVCAARLLSNYLKHTKDGKSAETTFSLSLTAGKENVQRLLLRFQFKNEAKRLGESEKGTSHTCDRKFFCQHSRFCQTRQKIYIPIVRWLNLEIYHLNKFKILIIRNGNHVKIRPKT